MPSDFTYGQSSLPLVLRRFRVDSQGQHEVWIVLFRHSVGYRESGSVLVPRFMHTRQQCNAPATPMPVVPRAVMVSCCLPAVSTGHSGDRRRRIGPTIPAVRLKPHQRAEEGPDIRRPRTPFRRTCQIGHKPCDLEDTSITAFWPIHGLTPFHQASARPASSAQAIIIHTSSKRKR